MSRPGFRHFSTPRLAAAVWVVLVLTTALFVALGWSLLQMGLLVVPLLAVALAVTVAARRNGRRGVRP